MEHWATLGQYRCQYTGIGFNFCVKNDSCYLKKITKKGALGVQSNYCSENMEMSSQVSGVINDCSKFARN